MWNLCQKVRFKRARNLPHILHTCTGWKQKTMTNFWGWQRGSRQGFWDGALTSGTAAGQVICGGTQKWEFFSGGERGISSDCSGLVRVRDCPPHQLATRHSWGRVYKVSVIFFLSLCHCFLRFFNGRLKRTCLHRVLFPFGENNSRNLHNALRGF